MVRLAIAGNPAFDVSDIELRRGGISYTVDTLKELRTEHPSDALYLLIGMDNVRDFHTWKDPDTIQRMAHVVVMTRPGFQAEGGMPAEAKGMAVCDVPEIAISSREIRNRVRQGRSIRYLVMPAVLEYVAKNRLYRR